MPLSAKCLFFFLDGLYNDQISVEVVTLIADLDLSDLVGHELYYSDLAGQDPVRGGEEGAHRKPVDMLPVEPRQVQPDRDILEDEDIPGPESGGGIILYYGHLLEELLLHVHRVHCATRG